MYKGPGGASDSEYYAGAGCLLQGIRLQQEGEILQRHHGFRLRKQDGQKIMDELHHREPS